MSKLKDWKKEFKDHKILILVSFIFLIIALLFNHLAGAYVSKIQGVPAPDLILDHIPAVDLSFIFIYGDVIIIAILILYPLFYSVKDTHKVISQFSLLIMVRAAFITFTHLQLPLEAIKYNPPSLLSFFFYQNDLFFSGHTAVAFLGFLLFKDSKIRYFFLASSIIMAAVVLLMHVHYTIDVFSAFFITYGTFKAGGWFFDKVNHY